MFARAGQVEGVSEPGRRLGRVAGAVQQRQDQLGEPHPPHPPGGHAMDACRALLNGTPIGDTITTTLI